MSDFDIEKRKQLLIGFGTNTAKNLTKLTKDIQKPEITDTTVYFNEASTDVDQIVRNYFSRVMKFKEDYNFRKGALLNCSKISAIWGITLLEHGPGKLFRVEPSFAEEFEKSAIAKMAVPLLVYRSAINILRIDPARIGKDTEDDLFRCLTRYPHWPISVEWLSWSLELLRQHNGCPEPAEPNVCVMPA